MMIFSIYLYFCPSVINKQESDCFLFLSFLETVEIAEIGVFCAGMSYRLLSVLFAGFTAGGKANMWQNGPASAPVTMGDVRPVDYYGNEVTQMFRKKKKKQNTKTKQDANTEIIAIKTL